MYCKHYSPFYINRIFQTLHKKFNYVYSTMERTCPDDSWIGLRVVNLKMAHNGDNGQSLLLIAEFAYLQVDFELNYWTSVCWFVQF